MATQDFTERPAIDRETATRLNPFISSYSSRDTFLAVRDGLEFIGLAALSTGEGGSDLTAEGMRTVIKAMSVAMRFEIEAQSQGGAL